MLREKVAERDLHDRCISRSSFFRNLDFLLPPSTAATLQNGLCSASCIMTADAVPKSRASSTEALNDSGSSAAAALVVPVKVL